MTDFHFDYSREMFYYLEKTEGVPKIPKIAASEEK